ncbi:MAG TPA: DNA methyltransferase [Salinimicrobium sp.]|nr:DNA methyltransferase [Salinimicrobium sp.]
MEYVDFLKNKVVLAEKYGFEPQPKIGNILPHAESITQWALKGGRRAIFASFGLTKTAMQLELAYQVIEKTGKPFLICMPLNVMREFKNDNKEYFQNKYETEYITDTDTISTYEKKVYMTNYARVRMGDIDASKFGGVSMDEASILRNLKTETTNYVLKHFKQVPYRFVATATPSPNEWIEILNYSDYLGIADRGHILTRFFKRNSTKAGDLTLLPNKKKEFWQWVSTWAVFITKPSDLGFSDEGYNLPELKVIEHRIENITDEVITNKRGEFVLVKEQTGDLQMASAEKRETIDMRVKKAFEIVQQEENQYSNWILWHHLEDERRAIEKQFKEGYANVRSVFGAQTNALKEQLLGDYSEGKYQILATKASIAGSGSNFQHVCHKQIWVGIDDKFNDFIQGVHRTYRFRAKHANELHIIYTSNEDKRFENLMRKWEQHKELQKEMIALVKEYGLNDDLIRDQMERQLFEQGDKVQIGDATLYNNDNVIAMDDIEENSIGCIVTSIPFGDHYEYSSNYNDFGHNHGNGQFFKQMDFLTPKLYKALKPGHVAAIHVKDRIRYSYQNGTAFTTIEDFSGQTVQHYLNHGFHLMGKITVTTDVVAENNQTYRLGHSQQCRDANKMGAGLPEYILLFRKAPTHSNNSYSDEPVMKARNEDEVWCRDCNDVVEVNHDAGVCAKCGSFEIEPWEVYPVDLWQLDAHAYHRSSGNRIVPSQLAKKTLKDVVRRWNEYQKEGLYDFEIHKELSSELNKNGKLSREYMTIPPRSNNDFVWDDIQRTKTLNAKQVSRKKEKHICPLQLDIIERLINRFTNKGDIVLDPFGGLMSVPHEAIRMGRKAIGIELNTEYYKDGLFYVRSIHEKISAPTLFDMLKPVETIS